MYACACSCYLFYPSTAFSCSGTAPFRLVPTVTVLPRRCHGVCGSQLRPLSLKVTAYLRPGIQLPLARHMTTDAWDPQKGGNNKGGRGSNGKLVCPKCGEPFKGISSVLSMFIFVQVAVYSSDCFWCWPWFCGLKDVEFVEHAQLFHTHLMLKTSRAVRLHGCYS